MGVVVEAEHVGLRQRVALKFLHPAAAVLEEPVARFLREARAASAIRSEHVARVLDVGTLDGGAPYIVMEYLTGTDLRGIVGRRGPLAVEDAVDYVLQACEALAEAHALGIVHRDIKPSNLFLTNHPDGSPFIKVLDFGIAKVLRPHSVADEDLVTLTGNGLVVGSPRYLPPERLRDPSNVDARTDIWAIGIVLHELLTGESPFDAKTVSSLYYKIAADPPTPVRRSRPDVPGGLEDAILRCLAKDPAKRTPDVAKLAASLRPFAPERSDVSVRRVMRVIAAPSRPGASRVPFDQEPSSESRGVLTGAVLTRTAQSASRRSALLGLVGGALLVAGALAGGAGHRVLGAPAPIHAEASPAAPPQAAPLPPANRAPLPAALPSDPQSAGVSVPARVNVEAIAPAVSTSVPTAPVASAVPRRAPVSSVKGVRARDPLGDRQ
jgi:serine/threonine-protein kinase